MLTGTQQKLDAFIQAVGDAVILEVVRSGVSGHRARGSRAEPLRPGLWVRIGLCLARQKSGCIRTS